MSAKGGITKGKSHKEGGIPMVVKSTGQQVELEGGEGVINKRNMASEKTFEFEGKEKTICEIASEINSADGNGVKIDCDNVTGKKYEYATGGKILDEEQEQDFKEWMDDGNVYEVENGVYTTQDAQWRNRVKGMDELRKYFRKEFLSDSYAKGGGVFKFPIAIERKINEINELLPKVKEADEIAGGYFGSTHYSYVQLEKPIEIKGKYVYIHSGNGRYDYSFEKRYNVNNLEDDISGRKGLQYDLSIILKAFKSVLKDKYEGGGEVKTTYVHKYNPNITLEVIEYTNKGVKGLQRNPKSLSKKEKKEGIIVNYSDSELKELFERKYANGGSVEDYKSLIGKYVYIHSMGVPTPTENKIEDVMVSDERFRHRDITLKFDIGFAIIPLADADDFMNNEIIYVKDSKEEYGVQLIPNQFAKGGKTPNNLKLEDYETASMSLGGYEEQMIVPQSTTGIFEKGGYVVYAENNDGYYRKLSQHDTMLGAKRKMNNIWDSGEYEKVGAISAEEWEKKYAQYQFKEGGGVDEIKQYNNYQEFVKDNIGIKKFPIDIQGTSQPLSGATEKSIQEQFRLLIFKNFLDSEFQYNYASSQQIKDEYLSFVNSYYNLLMDSPKEFALFWKKMRKSNSWDALYDINDDKHTLDIFNKYQNEMSNQLKQEFISYRKKYGGEDLNFKEGGDVPKASKMFHLPLELAVYVPSTQDVDKVISESELEARVDEVSKYLAKTFGGFTKSERVGGFMTSKSELVTEDVVPVVSFATREDYEANKNKLVNKLSEWSRKWGQEAIGFEFEGDLYYVPQKFDKGGRVRYYLNGFEESLNYILNSTNGKEVAREGSKEDGDLIIYFETTDEEYEYAQGGEVKENNYRISISENDKYIGEYPDAIATLSEAKSIFLALFTKYRRPQYLISVNKRPTSSSGYEIINVDDWYAFAENFEKGGDVRDFDWFQSFKKQQLKKGTEHEMEHIDTIKKFKKKGVSDREVAKAIAKDHLDENENYYIELDNMKESSEKVSSVLEDFEHQKSKRKVSRKYKLGGYMSKNEPVNVHIKLTKDYEAVIRDLDGTYLNDIDLKKGKIYKFGFLYDDGQNVAFDLGHRGNSYILIPSNIVKVEGFDEEKMALGGEVKSYAESRLDRNDKSILKLLLKIDAYSASAEQRDKISTFKGNNVVNELSPKLIQKIYGILFQNHNIDNKIENLYLSNIGVGNIAMYAPAYLSKTMVNFDEKNDLVQVEKDIANIVTLGKRLFVFNEFDLVDMDGFIHVYSQSNPKTDELCQIFYKSRKKAVAVGVCEFTTREKLNEFQRSITINQGAMAINQMISVANSNEYMIINEGITSEGQFTLIYTMTKF